MKTCARCKMALNTAEEHHIIIQDKKGKVLQTKLFYHRECWREIMTGKAALANIQKEAGSIMKAVKKQMGLKEEYII